MKSDEKRNENIPVVDVIASGYEWICPDDYCGTLNNLIAFPRNPVVVCSECGHKVELNIPEHARD